MISRQYNSNLNQATYQLNKAATTAYDYRAFEKPSEDPFLAGQTFQVRRQLALNEDYTSNISSLKGEVSSATSNLDTVYGILSNAKTSVLAGINGTYNDSNRDDYAKNLEMMQKAILSDMNAQYGNRYLFSGAGKDGEAPFSVDSNGNLLYRGINVDTGENTNGASTTISYDYNHVTASKSMQINFGTGIYDKLNGCSIQLSTVGTSNSVAVSGNDISVTMKSGATKKDLQDFLHSNTFQTALSSINPGITLNDVKQITISGIDAPDVGADIISESGIASSTKITNFVSLDDLAKETSYVDIGLGMKTENGNVVDQSAYNAAMPGISFLSYGTTTVDGASIPKNAYSLLGKMAGILRDGSVKSDELMKTMEPYTNALNDAMDEFSAQKAQLGTNSTFLDSTNTYITNVNLNLAQKDEDVEYVDPADAITNYTMQIFCYQAALQVGSNILQPTLLDFMK
jgi:flagellar hook-associated protein 3